MAQTTVKGHIKAPVARVWQVVSSFDTLEGYLAPVASTRLSGSGEGAIRHCKMQDGADLTEQLDMLDEANTTMRYHGFEPMPLPLTNYVSTMKLSDDGKGGTDIDWSVTFEPKGASEAEVIGALQGLYEGGIAELNRQLA